MSSLSIDQTRPTSVARRRLACWQPGHRATLIIAILGVLGLMFMPFLAKDYGFIIYSDGIGYYAYLPATFIERDLTFETMKRLYFEGAFPFQPYPSTGINLNKYPIGVAVMLLPFFLAAHAISALVGAPLTGWAPIYQVAAGLGGLSYMVLGVALLRELLARHFSERVVVATLACIVFGTNLYHYGTFDPTMSHAYSFFLITALLLATPWWYERPTIARSALLGVVAGLIVLTRNLNVLFLVTIPLYGLRSRADVTARLRFFWSNLLPLAMMALVAALLLLPQLAYWRFATGSWLIYSYQGEGFNFAQPRLLEVLFSVQKGLFFWSPLLLLAVAGFWGLRRFAPAYLAPVLVALPLHTYLVASWHSWQFGWSYGHRAFTDTMAFFALGLAAFLATLRGRRARAAGICCAMLVALSIFQMFQYWQKIVPPQDTTWEIYRSIFLRLW
ncbi:MAG: hypothetical protein SNJ69_03355 [Chloroflexaceae bacterium]